MVFMEAHQIIIMEIVNTKALTIKLMGRNHQLIMGITNMVEG